MRIFVVLFITAMAAMLTVGSAGAAVTQNESIPITDFHVYVPCANGGAGDVLTLNGELHILLTMTVNGTHRSISDHFQPQDLHGTDTEGHAYNAVGVTRDHFAAGLVNRQYTTTRINNFYLVGTGGAPSFKTHETLHVTVNAKGNMTVDHDNLRITCG